VKPVTSMYLAPALGQPPPLDLEQRMSQQWTATPLWLPYALGVLPRVYNKFALLERLILINGLDV
jgi:hypothetical protein